MNQKKYTKAEKIYLYRVEGSGRWTRYKDRLTPEETRLLNNACACRYAKRANSAPRGGKHGEHYEILKSFTADTLRRKAARAAKAFEAKLAQVLPSEKIDCFSTISDRGQIVIDGKDYSNFYGDGENAVEVCAVDADAFRAAEYITRRQVYEPRGRLTVEKFDAPKALTVSETDCGRGGQITIKNAVGFCVWERKAKIFVDGGKVYEIEK